MSDLRLRRCPISGKIGKKWEKREKGAGYNPWKIWSDPRGARLHCWAVYKSVSMAWARSSIWLWYVHTKETCIYVKRPTKETYKYAYNMSELRDMRQVMQPRNARSTWDKYVSTHEFRVVITHYFPLFFWDRTSFFTFSDIGHHCFWLGLLRLGLLRLGLLRLRLLRLGLLRLGLWWSEKDQEGEGGREGEGERERERERECTSIRVSLVCSREQLAQS